MIKRLVQLALVVALLPTAAGAAVRLPHVFSDGMVLQRGEKVPVWGWADPGEQVAVRIAGQEKSAAADAAGKWTVTLDPLAPGPAIAMSAAGKANTVAVRDVLVGDVFLCSGQSNMAMSMDSCKRLAGTLEDIKSTNVPELRFFQAPNATFADKPQEDVEAKWEPATAENNAHFSAIAFYFGKAMHEHLKVPIGILRASHGGGAAEIKMPLEALLSVPCGKAYYKGAMKRASPESVAARNRLFQERYEKAVSEAKAKGAKPPDPPKPAVAVDGGYPSSDWNGVIAPVIRYAKRGILWYQGEHNAGRAYAYREIFPVLIRSWREAAGRPDLPFIFVQLPAFGAAGKGEDWPLLRESQLVTLRQAPNTAMVVAIDTGEKDNIHPADKKVVGERLALEARRLIYGENTSGCGPLYDGFFIEGSSVVVRFKVTGKELKSSTGPQLGGFTVAGTDRKFVPATTVIRGDTVVVSSPAVPFPVAARYAWEGFPTVSLFDERDLPASPFQTDDWEN